MEAGTTSTTLTAKLHILNPGYYDLRLMRIEQYFLMTDYSLSEVIKNGSKVLKKTVGETEQEYKPTTTEEKQDRMNEMKARGTLLIALPNKDQLKFHSYKDAKLLMEAIKKSSETMDQSFDRLKKLISRLEIQSEVITQEDMNLKLFRSLPSKWKTHALIWRNKQEIETISLDDLYNKLKIYEPEISRPSSTSQNPQNMAFVSYNSTNSNNNTNEADNTAYGVSAAYTQSNPTSGDNLSDAVICAFLASQPNSPQFSQEDLEQIDPDDLEEMDLQWEMAILTIRARRFIKRTSKKLNVNGQRVGFDRSKVECYNCHKYGHFARECRLPRNQEKRGKENNKRTVIVETPTKNALVAQDGLRGYDWSYQAEEEHPINFTLMARTSSESSSSSDSKVDSCSKSCVKAYATLKEQYDSLSSDYKKSQFNLLSYKAVKLRDNALVENKKKLEKAEKERDELKLTLEKFQNSSKSLNNLLESQVSVKFKTGLGYNAASSTTASPAVESFVNSSEMLENQENNKSKSDKGYHAVPPPYTGNFIPFKPDLTFMDEIVESENMDVTTIVTPSNVKTVESNHESAGVKSNGDAVEPKTVRKNSFRPPVIEDWNSDDDSEVEFIPNVKDKTVRPSTEKIKFVKSARETVEKRNPQQKEYKEKGVINSGCSRHMTGNKCYLIEYEDYYGGFVSFRDGKGRIFGKVLTLFPLKVIKREFSVARTPRQNGVVERRNKTLIEAARTMLVDSKFPTTFWDEAVNTACYVLNRVLVIKPHNKKPYELIRGRTPLIDFMKPFGCLVTILNTRDHLGKFDGKADEGFFVGYSVVSKAMRVFNKRTKIVEEPLNIRFLHNIPNVTRNGPEWLFDVDSLTISINNVPVVAENETNSIAGTRDNIVTGQAEKKTEPEQEYILIPIYITNPLISQDPKVSKEDAEEKPTKMDVSGASDKDGEDDQATRSKFERLLQQEKQSVYPNNTNSINTFTLVSTAGPSCTDDDLSSPVNVAKASNAFEEHLFELFSPFKNAFTLPPILNVTPMDDTGIFGNVYNDEHVGAEADLNNLETTMNVSPIPTTRIDKDHSKDQIIRDFNSAIHTRRITKISDEHAMVCYINKQRRTNHKDYQNYLFAYFLSQMEPKKVIQDLDDPSSIEAMQEELIQFQLQKVWTQVNLPNGKRAIGIKWIFRNKKDERGILVRNKERIVAQGYTHEEGIDYNEVFAPIARIEAIRAWYETLSTYLIENGFRRGTIDKTLFINKDKSDILLVQVYVDDIIFGSTKKSLCNEFEQMMHKKFQMSSIEELTFFLGLQVQQKKDGIFISQDKYVANILKKFDFATVKTASTPMMIFRYLKDQPKLGLWYLRDSPFDLEVFFDSDYARASLNRKSTTGGCQFLGKRLISWQCKKQTIVANSTAEAEYVLTANCYGHVLWIQNQMLDYGFYFMNTKIFIDNESTICILKNPVFHSKTKHIEIRHHFIRDCYEKKLIQVIKIHIDHNVADLLTKAFDVSRLCINMDPYEFSHVYLVFSSVLVMNRDHECRKRLYCSIRRNAGGDSVERSITTAASLVAALVTSDKHPLRTVIHSNVYDPCGSGNWFRCGEDSMEYHDDFMDFVPPTPHDSPLLGGNTPGSDEGRIELIQLMETCTSLTKRGLVLEEAMDVSR
ncbi:uncharacterized mitochondrial protein-like protein [Tanacetum coccineum]|uniref:Uncharacterized mitochondrial protein-like protein n=1 Tax=Tanacetum coccineum TaxID=301880 RepID=A0ABQ5BLI3_9ASTR